jgi:hypothetical protein
MMDTRTWIRQIAACLIIFASTARAQTLGDERIGPAVTSGLAFLARQQNDDGSFEAGPRLAKTAVALLAFLSAGHAPDVGRYGLTVRKATDFILASAPVDGYFGRIDGSRMYGQGIVVVALAEAYAVECDPQQRARIRAAVEVALRVIINAQQVEKLEPMAGGWRYEPQSADSDLSLTAWNLLALRAARCIGIDVPQQNLDRATAFVHRCYRGESFGFANQPQGEVTASATAMGVTLLALCGAPDKPEVKTGSNLLLGPQLAQSHFVPSALHWVMCAASHLPKAMRSPLERNVREIILSSQAEDGGWPFSRSADEPGRVFSTALAVMTLTAPQELLGVYQR